jgi:ribosomal protein S15P/S13E
MTVEQIIQESVKDAKLEIEKARRMEIRRLLDYYTGTETDKYIDEYFSADAFREIPLYNANFTRRFVNKMSRIYTVGASRNMGDQYGYLTRKKDARLKHVERMTRLCGTIATQVIYRDDLTNPCFDYRPIYYFTAHFGDNPFVPTAITYPILFGVDDPSVTEKLQYAYWDSERYVHYDEDGNIMDEYDHGYGVIPFLFTHKEELIDSFFVEGATDIAGCNEQVNITMTELQLGLRFQMFGQPFITGLNGDKALERAGSDTILDLPEGANFGIVSPSGNIESVIENVKFQIDLVAQNNHLYVQFAQDGGETPSGIALKIKDLERFEDYQDDLELWNMYEHDLYEIEKAIAGYNGISLPEELNVDFNEPEYPKTVRDQIDLDNHRLANNLVTQGKLLVEYNKDLTIEEADAIIQENKQKNEKLSLFDRVRQETQRPE